MSDESARAAAKHERVEGLLSSYYVKLGIELEQLERVQLTDDVTLRDLCTELFSQGYKHGYLDGMGYAQDAAARATVKAVGDIVRDAMRDSE